MSALKVPSLRSCPFSPMKYNIPAILYVVLQFVAFFFVLVGTPLDVFLERHPPPNVNPACVTLWGFKEVCQSVFYTSRLSASSACPSRLRRFRAAQVFVIISILVYMAAFILGLILLFCCPLLRRVCLALNGVGTVTLCIVWGLIAWMYNMDDSTLCRRFKDGTRYGAGFVLFVLAWILDVINIFLLLLPYAAVDDGANRKGRAADREGVGWR